MDDQKKLEGIKKNIDVFKESVLEKFEDYIQGITLLPPGKDKDVINLLLMIDDSDSKKMSKVELKEKLTRVIEDIAKKSKADIKPEIVLNSDFLEDSYDNKHEITDKITNSAIVYDKGMLSAIKVSSIHKSMVLERFEKYIVSYVVGGSVITSKSSPDSDIDSFVIIDDTDVKKMTRAELKDKLRGIISSMSYEARQQAGIQRDFHVQVYILTDFWENLKDANPVIFTFIRDGVPLYDRGVFMPWKHLLLMGKVKPSPEAIDMLMTTGEQMLQRIDQKLKEIGLEDFFWTTITSSQAAIMLYGLPPPVPKETASLMRDLFVKKEKMIDDKHVRTFEKVMKLRKSIERNTKTKVSGKEIDELYADCHEYLKAMKVLFEKIEVQKSEENISKVSQDLDNVLIELRKTFGIGKDVGVVEVLKQLERENKIPMGVGSHYADFCKMRDAYVKKKVIKKEIDKAIGLGRIIIRHLVDSIHRRKSLDVAGSKVRIKKDDLVAEMVFSKEGVVLFKDLENPGEVLFFKKGKAGYLKPKKISQDKAHEYVDLVSGVNLTSGLYKLLVEVYGEGFDILF